MRERLERGEDAHDATTRLVFGIGRDRPEWDRYRSIGKRLTFGMLYGAGVRTVREQIETRTGVDASDAEVEEWVTNYRSAFPDTTPTAIPPGKLRLILAVRPRPLTRAISAQISWNVAMNG